jgi:hypothetical protein
LLLLDRMLKLLDLVEIQVLLFLQIRMMFQVLRLRLRY